MSCKRVGCRVPASTSLVIDAGTGTVTLVDVETLPVGVTLCAVHVASVSAPMNWNLVDARDANLRLLTVEEHRAPAVAATVAVPEVTPAAEPGPAEEPVPGEDGPEPAAGGGPSAPEPPAVEELFPWFHRFSDDDEPKTLNASSPLLSRAFRSAV